MTTTHIDPKHLARVLSRADLYRLNASALQALCEIAATPAESITMGDLARKLEASPAAITGIADSLETLGFITRIHSRKDRRVIWLNLTDRGRDALADILEA